MTKVEELREDVLGWFSDPYDYAPATEAVDSLIAAAEAQGVEKGAEQERERIVRGSQRFSQGDDVSDSDYITTDYATKVDFAAVADCELFVVPAYVLAPKEKP